jgi:DNA-binding MarR family transcriptional regulator
MSTSPAVPPPSRGRGRRAAPDPAEVAHRLRLPATRLGRLLRQQDNSGLAPTLTAVLATLGRQGPLTMTELAAAEQVAPATVSRAVAKLETRAMVSRRPVEGDGRSCQVELTDAGRRQLAANRTRRQAWLTRQLTELDTEDLVRLDAAIDVLERLTGVTR